MVQLPLQFAWLRFSSVGFFLGLFGCDTNMGEKARNNLVQIVPPPNCYFYASHPTISHSKQIKRLPMYFSIVTNVEFI
jgi:hypothetical protein